MIYLDLHTKKLQIVSTVADLQWTVSYNDITIPCFGNISSLSKELQGLTTIGTVDMILAPSTNTNTYTYSKEVEYISVYNSSESTATVTVQIDISGTSKTLYKVTLNEFDFLIYNEDSGLQAYDNNGAIKTTSASISTNFVTNEVPTGLINSSNVTYTLANTPITNSEMVYYQGQLQRPTLDYTISGNTITFVTAPDTGTSIYVSYRY